MQRACPKQDHLGSPVTFICTNPSCKNNRFLCLTCLNQFHQGCLNHILDINIIQGRNLLQNINWISDPDIRQAVLNLKKPDSVRSPDQFFHIFKDKIEKEYDKLSEYFQMKIQEAKENRIRIFQESLPLNINSDQFTAQTNALYNFDPLIQIIDHWQSNAKGDNLASKELDGLFKEILSNQNDLKFVKELAQNINFLNHEVKCDLAPFEKFIKSLDNLFPILEVVDDLPKKIDLSQQVIQPKMHSNSWEWDPLNKSDQIILSENGRKAHKVATIKTFSGVLGNMRMSEGKFKWEIETMGATNQNGLAFGIFESKLVKSFEPVNWADGIWQSTNSNTSAKMTKVKTLQDYKNKIYVCELDFYNDIFTISHEGVVISEKRGGIKDHTFAPFALLSYNQNAVRLRILDNGNSQIEVPRKKKYF